MANPHEFETESAMLVGALGALLSRSLDEGNTVNSFDDYCLLTLLREQARRVQDIGMELLFPNMRR